MTDESLSDLRRDIARLRTLSTKKISRVKTHNGARLSGSGFDPRRDKGIEQKYTRSQLNAYRAELKGFLSRSNQFEGGSRGFPMTRDAWNEYKSREQEFNSRMRGAFDKYKGIKLPSGMTIEARMAMRTPTHPEMSREPLSLYYNPVDRKPAAVHSEKRLRELVAMMDKRNDKNWDANRLASARETMDKMAERIGDEAMRDAIANLSDEQFFVLWNYSDMPDDASMWYVYATNQADPSSKAKAYIPEGAMASVKAEYRDLLKWAQKLKF